VATLPVRGVLVAKKITRRSGNPAQARKQEAAQRQKAEEYDFNSLVQPQWGPRQAVVAKHFVEKVIGDPPLFDMLGHIYDVGKPRESLSLQQNEFLDCFSLVLDDPIYFVDGAFAKMLVLAAWDLARGDLSVLEAPAVSPRGTIFFEKGVVDLLCEIFPSMDNFPVSGLVQGRAVSWVIGGQDKDNYGLFNLLWGDFFGFHGVALLGEVGPEYATDANWCSCNTH
jgi:hypothetical protein